MDQHDEKPKPARIANDTVIAGGRGGLLHKMRLMQTKSAQAESPLAGVKAGYPKRRKPSMPPMPWDKKDESE
jgi:hypothetical protein